MSEVHSFLCLLWSLFDRVGLFFMCLVDESFLIPHKGPGSLSRSCIESKCRLGNIWKLFSHVWNANVTSTHLLIARLLWKKYKNVIPNMIFIIMAYGKEKGKTRKLYFSRPLPSLEPSRLLLHLLII